MAAAAAAALVQRRRGDGSMSRTKYQAGGRHRALAMPLRSWAVVKRAVSVLCFVYYLCILLFFDIV